MNPDSYSIESYQIENISEEGACEYCGSELFSGIGDTNYEVISNEDGEPVEAGFDSKSCANKWLENWCKDED